MACEETVVGCGVTRAEGENLLHSSDRAENRMLCSSAGVEDVTRGGKAARVEDDNMTRGGKAAGVEDDNMTRGGKAAWVEDDNMTTCGMAAGVEDDNVTRARSSSNPRPNLLSSTSCYFILRTSTLINFFWQPIVSNIHVVM